MNRSRFGIKLLSACFLGYPKMTVSGYTSAVLLSAWLLKCGDTRVLGLLSKSRKIVEVFLFLSNTQTCRSWQCVMMSRTLWTLHSLWEEQYEHYPYWHLGNGVSKTVFKKTPNPQSGWLKWIWTAFYIQTSSIRLWTNALKIMWLIKPDYAIISVWSNPVVSLIFFFSSRIPTLGVFICF